MLISLLAVEIVIVKPAMISNREIIIIRKKVEFSDLGNEK